MTDDTSKKGSGFPGVDDDEELGDEFEAWDKNLDALFGDEEETGESRVGEDGEIIAAHRGYDFANDSRSIGLRGDEFENSLDFLEEDGQLDELLDGTPPPLQMPLDDSGHSSSERPSTRNGVVTSAARPGLQSPESDDMDDLFGGEGDVDGLLDEVTRILDVDDELLAASIPASRPVASRPTPKTPQRLTPTIVRRDELERMRAKRDQEAEDIEDEDGDYAFGNETTRIADIGQLESLMESAADPSGSSFFDDDDMPEISIAVDEEFYDDLVIGEDDADDEQEPLTSAPARRVSSHLVRRDRPRSDSEPAVISSTSLPRGKPSKTRVRRPRRGASDELGVVDPLTGELTSAGRDVDPEMTLDMRVSDLDLPPEPLSEPIALSESAVQPALISRSAIQLFDDDDDVETGIHRSNVKREPEDVVWPPTASVSPGHAFLDLEPSGGMDESTLGVDSSLSPEQAPRIEPPDDFEALDETNALGDTRKPRNLADITSVPGLVESRVGVDVDSSDVDEAAAPEAETAYAASGVMDVRDPDATPIPEEQPEERASTSEFADPDATPVPGEQPEERAFASEFADPDSTPIPGEAPEEVAVVADERDSHAAPVSEVSLVASDEGSPVAEVEQSISDHDEAAVAETMPVRVSRVLGRDAEFIANAPTPEASFPVRVPGKPSVQGGDDAPDPALEDLRADNDTYDFGLPQVVAAVRATNAATTSASGFLGGSERVPSTAAVGTQETKELDVGVLETQPLEPVSAAAQTTTMERIERADTVLPPALTGREPTPAELSSASSNAALKLPDGVLPRELPALDVSAIDVPDEVAPEVRDVESMRATIAAELALYERELDIDEFSVRAKEYRLEAGRLCEKLGETERARAHYEEALAHDPLLGPALRALRHIERAAGDWNAAMNYLDAELEEASEVEALALSAHKADVLMSVGEQDLARVVVGDRLDVVQDDIRALLANLELAFVDDRDDEFDQTLAQLAEVLSKPELVSCMHMLRGRLSERPVGQPSGDRTAAIEAYEQAADAGSSTALLALALAARQQGDIKAATGAIARLQGSELEALDPDYCAALHWRRAQWAAMSEDRAGQRGALAHAATLGQPDPIILAELARVSDAGSESEATVDLLTAWAEHAHSEVERSSAYVQLANCLSRLQRSAEAADALRKAVELDPSDPVAASALEQVLEQAGDVDALIELDRQVYESDAAGAILERVRASRRLIAAERYEQAIADLQAGREAAPESPAISDALLEVLLLTGDRERYRALLQALADDSGEMRDAEAVLQQLARTCDDHAIATAIAYDEAVERFKRAGADESVAGNDVSAAADGDDDSGADERPSEADIDALAGERERAITHALDVWGRVLDGDAGSLEAFASVIRLSSVLGDGDVLDDALSRAQQAAGASHHAVTLGLARAMVALSLKQPDIPRAEDCAREALELVPDDPRPPQLLINLAMHDNRPLDAAMVLEERAAAVSGAARAASLRYRAAALLIGRADEPAQAVALLGSVIEAFPRFGAARDMLALAHKKLGEPMDPAVLSAADEHGEQRSFEQLIRDAETHFYLSGDAPRALEVYERAVRQRPDDPIARHGLRAASMASVESTQLAALAIEDMKRAEERGHAGAKADAYERLADIDGALRGDEDSALMALESAAALDSTRVLVLRALERAYARDKRWRDLARLRDVQRASLSTATDVLGWRMDRASLVARAGDTEAVSTRIDEYRSIYELDHGSRLALFHLESERRADGPSVALAALECAAADYFAQDDKARAAFLTRSAETLADLGQLDDAIERFQTASQLCDGFAPALFGWRQAALAGERWLEVADAALGEAAASALPHEQVRLCHLAGVTLMDKARHAVDEETAGTSHQRAIEALERVISLEPGHRDAFVRLHGLYTEAERYDELARLMERRLEVETEPGEQVRLHRALADLLNTALDDSDGARHHLRSILQFIPNEPGAIEMLSEIAWAEKAWEEAAETLIVRARMTSAPEEQKDIFFRLGTIYADHQPQNEWAIKSFQRVLSIDSSDMRSLEYLARLGSESEDWQLALKASERLLVLDEDVDAKVMHLHRIGGIFSDGLGDRARAERAYLRALDLSPKSDEALSTLISFFESGGDMRSMRVHLDRVLGPMRSQLVGTPTDGSIYRVISRALSARERAGSAGSRAVARCAAELSMFLGAGGEQEAALSRDAAASRPSVAGLGQGEIDDVLFPAVVSNAVRQIFGLIGDRIAKHVGIDLRRYGVGRADRLKDPGAPILQLAETMASEFGLDAPAVYVSTKERRLLVAEPTSPISIVIGVDLLESADASQLAFAIGRSFKLVQSGLAVPARMTVDEFGVLMVALLRQFNAEFGLLSVDPDAVGAQQQRLRRLIPSSLIQQLRPFAIGIAGPDFDHEALWRGIVEVGNRAGLLACGSVQAAMALLTATKGLAGVVDGFTDAEIGALVRFAVSEDHASVRGQLGA